MLKTTMKEVIVINIVNSNLEGKSINHIMTLMLKINRLSRKHKIGKKKNF